MGLPEKKLPNLDLLAVSAMVGLSKKQTTISPLLVALWSVELVVNSQNTEK